MVTTPTNLVREGDVVSRGQVIASIGDSGRTTGANLHFEVRRDNTARNPLAYLPRPDQTAGISFARNTGGLVSCWLALSGRIGENRRNEC